MSRRADVSAASGVITARPDPRHGYDNRVSDGRHGKRLIVRIREHGAGLSGSSTTSQTYWPPCLPGARRTA